ncbi:protoporphyrinogen oxidase [Nocardioides szechwanensis]|nr:protoporphyrinogen oxidase [Nocardioides szechwanensis]
MDRMSAGVPGVVVVGGGIAGLTAAYRISRGTAPAPDVTVLEAADRLGGKIRTELVDGFLVEGGPDSLFASKPPAKALLTELEIAHRLLPTEEAGRGTSVLRGGRLRPLPEGLNGFVPSKAGSFARTRLFTPFGKCRLAFEYAVPARPDDGTDESLRSFAVRRLGVQVYRRLVEPLAAGIFAADPAQLSLAATMPHLRAAELEHGGLIRAMLAERRRVRARTVTDVADPPPPSLVAPVGGMGEIVDALAARLSSVDVRLGAAVTEVADGGDGTYLVRARNADGEETVLRAGAVVLAVPSAAAAVMVAALDPSLAAALAGTAYTSTVTVALGFRSDEVDTRLRGSGYLVPASEGRAARACTWSSSKYAGRAPDGRVLLRVSLGGPGRSGVLDQPDSELVAVARRELADVLGIRAEPVLSRVFRWTDVMPQYTVGHLDRLAALDQHLAGHPGLVVAGSGYHGLGVAECIGSGSLAAGTVLTRLEAVSPIRRP